MLHIGEDIVCICGEKTGLCEFDAWLDVENRVTHMKGMYSCSTPGCSGNVKEKNEKRLAAISKLTDDEKKMLDIWNWN